VTKEFSLDENLWHLSVEGGPLEDPTATVDVSKVLAVVAGRFAGGAGSIGVSPVSTATRVRLRFEQGIPVALDGDGVGLPDAVSTLNHQYRAAPWAWDLVIENRFTGIKSRGLYINPAAKLLHVAVDALARTCLNKTAYDQYVELGKQYGTMLYRGEFFSDQRAMLEAAASAAMRHLTGEVTVHLDPVPYACKIDAADAIFSKGGATFEKSNFSHADAGGFIQLTWLTSVGRSFSAAGGLPAVDGSARGGVEDGHDGDVEAGDRAASGVRRAESVPVARLVPAAV